MAGIKTGISGQINNNIVTDGLIFYVDPAYKKSYPGSGTTSTDLVNSVTGTLQSSGMFENTNNGVFDFDGATNYIDFGRFISLENTSTVSISFWLKIPSTGAKSYLGYWDHPNGWLIEADAYSVYFAIGNTSYNALKLAYSGNISTNIWYHIAMIFNGTQTGNANRLKVYLNGTQKTLTTHSSSVIPSSIPSIPNAVITIGGIIPATINGTKNIGPTQIYNRALSASEVLFNYNGLKSRFGL